MSTLTTGHVNSLNVSMNNIFFFNAILTMCIVFANVSNCIDTFPDELYNVIIIIIIIIIIIMVY